MRINSGIFNIFEIHFNIKASNPNLYGCLLVLLNLFKKPSFVYSSARSNKTEHVQTSKPRAEISKIDIPWNEISYITI